MVQWLTFILICDLAMFKLSLSEVTLSLRLLQYKNRNGLTYENRACDAKIENDINLDGRCDTGFLFCLVRLPFQNPHNCTLGDHFTGFVGADDIHFVNIDQHLQRSPLSTNKNKRRSSLISLWFQPTIYFHFKYPKTGIGLIVEVFDIDDVNNQSIHDSIDFYGRTLTDLKLYRSADVAQPQRIYLRSLFGTYTNLTADFSLHCSMNYYGDDCETFCLPDEHRYKCDSNTGKKICNQGYFGHDCLRETHACLNEPCQNNGTCVVYLRSYLCQCQNGYTGRQCEIDLNPSKSVCNNTTCIHGTCLNNGTCICHDGWTTKYCNESLAKKDIACASFPCLHNATCENIFVANKLLTYRCHCESGYTGRNCEVAIVTSCERTPCVHGQCLKINFYKEICVCENNWGGIDCSQSLLAKTTSQSPSTMINSITTTAKSTTTTTTTTTTTSITQSVTMRAMKNLTNLPITIDLSGYFDIFNGVNPSYKTKPPHHLLTTPSYSHKTKYSPCLSAPCLHNSTCVIQSESSFKCLCLPSFIGVYCEIQTNPCESSPCRYQSVCVAKPNYDVHCICRPQYTGKYCENAPPIHVTTLGVKCTLVCLNGGICSIDRFNNQKCICKTAYTGVHCEINKNKCNDSSCQSDPCLSNPCLSNGTCHSRLPLANFSCSCLEEYTGKLCESEVRSNVTYTLSRDIVFNQEESRYNTTTDLWPLAIVFGYVFSLMLVFIIIWFLWYGLTIRPHSYFRSDIPYGERNSDRYQPYRLGVSNPLFFTNQEYNPYPMLKTFSD